MLSKYRNVLKNNMFLDLTMAIPIIRQLYGQLYQTFSSEQFSANLDKLYNILSPIIVFVD